MPRKIAYRMLAERLRNALRRGEFDDGRPLPTEEQLARTYSLSRQTVRRALLELVNAGLVYRVAGRGTFALQRQERFISDFDSIEDLLTVSSDMTSEVISPLKPVEDPRRARLLRLKGDAVASTTLLRLHEGKPFGLTSIALKPSIGALLADAQELRATGPQRHVTLIRLIEDRKPGTIMSTEQSVSATTLPVKAARQMRCEPGMTVIQIERLYMDADNNPVEYAHSFLDPDHYTYRVRFRRDGR